MLQNFKVSWVIKDRTKAKCIVSMYPMQWPESMCFGTGLRGKGMETSSMYMLQLPSVFVWSDLPNRTFLAIQGIAPQKPNGFSSRIGRMALLPWMIPGCFSQDKMKAMELRLSTGLIYSMPAQRHRQWKLAKGLSIEASFHLLI